MLKTKSDNLVKFVRPLYCTGDNQRPLFVGTGFFYFFKSELFLISACHVFDSIKFQRSPIYVGLNDKLIRLNHGPIYRTFDENNALDLAIFKIKHRNDDYDYMIDVSVINNDNFEEYGNIIDGHFLVQGYPYSRNKQSPNSVDFDNFLVRCIPFSKAVNQRKEVDYLKFNKNKETHYALHWPVGKGDINPNGLSGGPLWFIPKNTDDKILMGVFIEHWKKESIGFATKLGIVEEVINVWGL